MLRLYGRPGKLWVVCFQSAGRYMVSFVLVIITQFALALVPRLLPASSLFLQLLLSVVVLLLVVGFGRCCRRLLRVSASAPALVLFNTLFVWGVYFVDVRPAVPRLVDVTFNGEIALLFIGLFRILSSDPGFMSNGVPGTAAELVETGALATEVHDESDVLPLRVRYCKSCKSYVKGFDHHCPAFGNCIGYKNHALFMVLLAGFLATEGSYVVFSFHVAKGYWVLRQYKFQSDLARSLVVSTMLFSLLQVLWQVFFLTWHIYCIFFNIRTDEWINWKKYPEFYFTTQPEPGESTTVMRFKNPYNKGIVPNLREFLGMKT
ncbi:unnamed protein product [Linum trigynum]|uniref:S-acyltransferase n=1 Tax=Linum trigynum TaxID=586398 RepID=A0AAV2FSA8_9ROSI